MAIKLTESRLRQIIREELSEALAPGVAAPRPPDIASEELSMMLDAMEQGVDQRLEDVGYDPMSASPEERAAAFDGNGLDIGPDQVYDIPSLAEDYQEYVGQTVGGLEALTDGSVQNTIVGFEYGDMVAVQLETDHGVMTLTIDDLAMY